MDRKRLGGQAVIEGVMMRAPRSFAVAVRRADGHIVTEGQVLRPASELSPILALPVVRGIAVLLESLLLGFRAFGFSSRVAADADGDRSLDFDSRDLIRSAAVLGVNALLLIALPLFAANMALALFTEEAREATSGEAVGNLNFFSTLASSLRPVEPTVAFNLLDGVVRLAVFVCCVAGLSLVPDGRRLFEYHGAEHKVIGAWEAGGEVTVKTAGPEPRRHARCGTNFLMVALMMSIPVFILIRFDTLMMSAAGRLVLMPIIAGLAYEVIRASVGRARWLVGLLSVPGLLLQRVTTREPDDSQLEVAILALRESIRLDQVAESKTAEIAG